MPSLFEYHAGRAGVHDASVIVSPDRKYRYHLRRKLTNAPTCMTFVMLNPSDADENTNDATVRRCIGFAGRERFGTLSIVNLFALVAHNPRRLLEADDPVGPGNDMQLTAELHSGIWRRHVIVAAWGAIPAQHKQLTGRATLMADLIDHAGYPIHALGLTDGGHPRHPLYLPGDTPLIDVTHQLLARR